MEKLVKRDVVDKSIIQYNIGSIKDKKLKEVIDSICDVIKK